MKLKLNNVRRKRCSNTITFKKKRYIIQRVTKSLNNQTHNMNKTNKKNEINSANKSNQKKHINKTKIVEAKQNNVNIINHIDLFKIQRRSIEEHIRNINEKTEKRMLIVSGVHGCGKTILITDIAEKMNMTTEFVHFDIACSDTIFEKELLSSLVCRGLQKRRTLVVVDNIDCICDSLINNLVRTFNRFKNTNTLIILGSFTEQTFKLRRFAIFETLQKHSFKTLKNILFQCRGFQNLRFDNKKISKAISSCNGNITNLKHILTNNSKSFEINTKSFNELIHDIRWPRDQTQFEKDIVLVCGQKDYLNRCLDVYFFNLLDNRTLLDDICTMYDYRTLINISHREYREFILKSAMVQIPNGKHRQIEIPKYFRTKDKLTNEIKENFRINQHETTILTYNSFDIFDTLNIIDNDLFDTYVDINNEHKNPNIIYNRIRNIRNNRWKKKCKYFNFINNDKFLINCEIMNPKEGHVGLLFELRHSYFSETDTIGIGLIYIYDKVSTKSYYLDIDNPIEIHSNDNIKYIYNDNHIYITLFDCLYLTIYTTKHPLKRNTIEFKIKDSMTSFSGYIKNFHYGRNEIDFVENI